MLNATIFGVAGFISFDQLRLAYDHLRIVGVNKREFSSVTKVFRYEFSLSPAED